MGTNAPIDLSGTVVHTPHSDTATGSTAAMPITLNTTAASAAVRRENACLDCGLCSITVFWSMMLPPLSAPCYKSCRCEWNLQRGCELRRSFRRGNLQPRHT